MSPKVKRSYHIVLEIYFRYRDILSVILTK